MRSILAWAYQPSNSTRESDVSTTPGARSAAENPVFTDVTGQITVPLLTLHGTADAFVPYRFEQEYLTLTTHAGTSNLVVQRSIRRPGHCKFTDQERGTALDDLVGWRT